MKKFKVVFLCLIYLFSTVFVNLYPMNGSIVQAAATTYYVSTAGNDQNNGTSEATPWKTLTKVSSVTFQPGDTIFLKGGDVWDGEFLDLHGSGDASNPITLTSYGTGRPKIQYNGTVVKLENISGWNVKGLEIKILSENTLTSGSAWVPAVKLSFTGTELYRDLTLDNNIIYGEGYNRSTCGIYIVSQYPYEKNEEVARNITISNNDIHDLGWYGINSFGWNQAQNKALSSPALYSNVKVFNNSVYNLASQGIVLGNVNHSSIKWNVVHHCGQYSGNGITWGPGGIWPMYSSYVDMKFNEVYSMSDSNSGYDGAGLNIDSTCDFVNLQYNYSHDNKGPGIETMAHTNSKILNNKLKGNTCLSTVGVGSIAISDASADAHVFTGVKNLEVSGNTIIVDKANTAGISTIHFTDGDLWSGNKISNNNIVLSSLSGIKAYVINSNTAVDQINNNNLYSSSGTMFAASKFGTQYNTLADWRNGTGYDLNSSTLGSDTTNPGAPSNVQAAVSGFAVNLSWTAATDSGSGVAHYNIYRSTTQNFVPAYSNMVGESATASFVDTEELNGSTTYYYKVEAEDKNGNVGTAASSSSVTTGAKPAEPLRAYQASKDFGAILQGPVWFYKYLNGANYTNISSFYAPWSMWREGSTFAAIGNNCQSPDAYDSVRAWVAPFTGSITLTAEGNIRLRDNGATADGIKAKVMKGSTQVWPSSGWQAVTYSSQVSFPATSLSVTKGDTLYFIVNKNGNADYDTTIWDPVITYTSITYPAATAAVQPTVLPKALTEEKLKSNFEDGTAAGWTASSGSWAVVTDGSKVYRQSNTAGGMAIAGESSWKEYILEASVKPLSFDAAGGCVGLNIMYNDASNRYSIQLNSNNTLEIKKFSGGTQTSLANKQYAISTGTDYSIKVIVHRNDWSGGQTIELYVNGLKELSATDASLILTTGKVALDTWRATAQYDDIYVNADVNSWTEPQDILLNSDFENGSTSGWTAASGNWSVATYKTMKYQQNGTAAAAAYAGDAAWNNYIVQSKVIIASSGTGGGYANLCFRYSNAGSKYFASISDNNTMEIKKAAGGTTTPLASKAYTVTKGVEYTLKVMVNGNNIDLYVNGRKELSAQDSALASGKIALETSNATVMYDDVFVQKLSPAAAPSFSDNFEGGSLSNWSAASGSWALADDTTKAYKQTGNGGGLTVAGSSTWTNYEVRSTIKINSADSTGGFACLDFRYTDSSNKYFVYLGTNNMIEIKKAVSGSQTSLAYKQYLVNTGREYRVKVAVNGSTIDFYINGVKELTATDNTFSSGKIALETTNATVLYDDIVVR